jgi:uncharacterized protein YjbI with pentapeptide repeats
MKHQIKHYFAESVLFECYLPDDTPVELVTRHALEKARLNEARLTGADLTGARLNGADLTGARLNGAHLTEADLTGARLNGAHLTEADLTGARLNGALLVGKRPIFQIGPLGSRCTYLTAYLTSKGVKLRTGCFFGTVYEFTAKLFEEHGNNAHAKEYRAALDLINHHAELWAPPTH